MPDYRNFADSIFSSEIWQNEGLFWLVLAAVILAQSAGFWLLSKHTKDDALQFATFWTAFIVVIAFALIVPLFSTDITRDFNRNVAEKNISAKYDVSKLKFDYYDPKTKTVRAYYSDKASSMNKELTFTFEKNEAEPFLVKYISDDSLNNIEKAISKAK